MMDAGRVHPVNSGTVAAKRHKVSVDVSLAITVLIHMAALLFKYAAFQRNDYCMSAVARFKLGQNTLYMSFDGMHREIQVIGDDLVGLSHRNGFQDIQLAQRESILSCMFGHRCSNLRGNPPLPGVNEPNGIDQI